MKFLSLPLGLFLALSLLIAIPAQGMDANGFTADTQNLFLFKKITLNDAMLQGYLIVLCKGTKENIIGYADVIINKQTNTAFLERLNIYSHERQKSYGSMLLKAVLKDAYDQSCVYIKWHASPFDLRADESKIDMLPRLLNFYQSHGAVIDAKSPSPNGMIYKFNSQRHIAEPQYQGKNIIMSRL